VFDGALQVRFGGDGQQDEVAGLDRLLKAATGFQAGVADLDELVGEGEIGPNEDVGIVRGRLGFRHRRSP
jgi:hypothetical protein